VAASEEGGRKSCVRLNGSTGTGKKRRARTTTTDVGCGGAGPCYGRFLSHFRNSSGARKGRCRGSKKGPIGNEGVGDP